MPQTIKRDKSDLFNVLIKQEMMKSCVHERLSAMFLCSNKASNHVSMLPFLVSMIHTLRPGAVTRVLIGVCKRY